MTARRPVNRSLRLLLRLMFFLVGLYFTRITPAPTKARQSRKSMRWVVITSVTSLTSLLVIGGAVAALTLHPLESAGPRGFGGVARLPDTGPSGIPPPQATSPPTPAPELSPRPETGMVLVPEPLPTEPPAPPPRPPRQAQATIAVALLNTVLSSHPAEEVTLQAQSAPGTLCTITVIYRSGPSHAQGLDPKTSDATGNVSWTWFVGSSTSPGKSPIVVSCGAAQARTFIEVAPQVA